MFLRFLNSKSRRRKNSWWSTRFRLNKLIWNCIYVDKCKNVNKYCCVPPWNQKLFYFVQQSQFSVHSKRKETSQIAHFLTAKTKLWQTTVDVHMSALRIPVDDLGVVVVKVIGDSLLCQLPAEHGQLGEALTAGLDGHQPVVIHSHQVVTGKKRQK